MIPYNLFAFVLTTKKLHDTTTKYIKAKILLQMSKADFEKIEKIRDEVYKETGIKSNYLSITKPQLIWMACKKSII